MIPVTQPFLPPKLEYDHLINKLWNSKWLTNNGVYVLELERKLKDFLGVPSLFFVNNGTTALQLALKALSIEGDVITTPFSFVATTTSILWEKCKPVFVDIDPRTLCINTDKIEEAITDKTEAILATHVYGNPCDVEKIEKIARQRNLKVIYDAAHAFGTNYKGNSILDYGDISILSFHATKLFHTVEGGGIINNIGKIIDNRIQLLRSFGFEGEAYHLPGINAKNSEFHAAMGLCNLNYIDDIIHERKNISQTYDTFLLNVIGRPEISQDVEYNYAYYPVIFKSAEQLLTVKKHLENHNVQSRRYFYPSLNKLPYLNNTTNCDASEDIAERILCLPLYNGLRNDQVKKIAELILERI